jgi:hypothetical protein
MDFHSQALFSRYRKRFRNYPLLTATETVD